jgi:ABC-type transporter Mla maintaining outer membrane lipid asymmetry ATPase subunit MlaF
MNSAMAIEIRNLSIDLDGQKVLNNVYVELKAGQIIGLLGPSGAGKIGSAPTENDRVQPELATIASVWRMQ